MIDKPFLKYWYANRQTEFVSEAAANLFDDLPWGQDIPKMSRLAFLTSLQNRVKGVKAAHKEMEKAQTIGTAAHALIEWAIKTEMLKIASGPRPEVSPEAEASFESWLNWRDEVELEPLYAEQIVYSEEHGYAGTVDLIAFLNLRDQRCDYGRTLASIDWKTSKAIYGESTLQAAAYCHAIAEMGHGIGPKSSVMPGLVVRLPKVATDPGFETKIVHVADHKSNFGAFLKCKDIWHWLRAQEQQTGKTVKTKGTRRRKIEPAEEAAKEAAVFENAEVLNPNPHVREPGF